ncbi:transcription initiation protein [Mycolicibacterium moriokaense]|nr:transcription initiation protein [Mycolicibacterium moriokaense]
MLYFALLISPERDLTPEQGAAEMAAYQKFHAEVGHAIRAGDALQSQATGARITGGPDAPVVTDGPFAEGAEVAGGYYVFEAENLDEALALARGIPAAQYGGVEVWPMVHFSPASAALTSDSWLALLLEPADSVVEPGSPQWDEGIRAHTEFGKLAGDRAVGGAPLHPPTAATTVRVRDGEVLLTDGPYAEGAEVANGFYYINAADRDEAVKVASMIPATTVELRRLAGVSSL